MRSSLLAVLAAGGAALVEWLANGSPAVAY